MDEYIAGKHAVLEALRSGRTVNKIWVAENANRHQIQPILEEAKQSGAAIQYVDKRKLDQMAGNIPHQGVVAQAAAYAYYEVEDLLEVAAERNEPPFLIILDEIEDPHNLGSILRTCDCAGAHGVIIPKRRSVGLTATVAKVSAGAIEYVRVARVTNITQTIKALQEQGIWVIGTDARAEQTVYELDLTMPIALVIGNEAKGMSRLVRESCDLLAKLPMYGHIHSLNASVAASVFLYEAVRQRHAAR